jgi:hypothetical protein
MIINTGLHASLAVGADKSTPQQGDDNIVVPAILSPVEKLLSPHNVVASATGRVANSSFISSFEKLRAASTGASADVLVTLSRGLWTIIWSMDCDFQSGGTPGQNVAVKLLVAMQADTHNVAGIFRRAAPLNCNGVFRLLLKEDANLRLDVVATAASDAIDVHVCLNGEKNI